MSIFQLSLAIFVSLISLASLVGYSVCVLASRSDAKLRLTTEHSNYTMSKSDLRVTCSEGLMLEQF